MNIKIISCQYDNPEKSSFTAKLKDIDNELFGGKEFPYGVIIGGDDPTEISQMLYAKYNSGKLVPDNYIIPEIPEDILSMEIRSKRDGLLANTDYLIQPDYPISDEARNVVKAYRQALRDITKQDGFPKDVVWPEKPEVVK